MGHRQAQKSFSQKEKLFFVVVIQTKNKEQSPVGATAFSKDLKNCYTSPVWATQNIPQNNYFAFSLV
jgi:hypothetical protein